MMVLDANILIYAYSQEVVEHQRARAFLQAAFSAGEAVGLPVHSVAAFLRIMTHPALGGARYSLPEAIALVDGWLGLPQVLLLVPGERHWTILRRLLVEGHAAGRLVTEAEIAALTVEYGGELQTNDRDFGRFAGLRWRNPLKG